MYHIRSFLSRCVAVPWLLRRHGVKGNVAEKEPSSPLIGAVSRLLLSCETCPGSVGDGQEGLGFTRAFPVTGGWNTERTDGGDWVAWACCYGGVDGMCGGGEGPSKGGRLCLDSRVAWWVLWSHWGD